MLAEVGHAGRRVWAAPAPAPAGISAFYGLTAGRVDLHMVPGDATISNGRVSSVPNRVPLSEIPGGNGIHTGGNLVLSGGMLSLNGSNYLQTIPVPLDNSRLFMVTDYPEFTGTLCHYFGQNATPRSNIRIATTQDRWQIISNDGSGWLGSTLVGGPVSGFLGRRLFEVELLNGWWRIFLGGVLYGAEPAQAAHVGFPVSFWGNGQGSPGIVGRIGDMARLRLGGPNDAAAIAAIRADLNAKWGT